MHFMAIPRLRRAARSLRDTSRFLDEACRAMKCRGAFPRLRRAVCHRCLMCDSFGNFSVLRAFLPQRTTSLFCHPIAGNMNAGLHPRRGGRSCCIRECFNQCWRAKLDASRQQAVQTSSLRLKNMNSRCTRVVCSCGPISWTHLVCRTNVRLGRMPVESRGNAQRARPRHSAFSRVGEALAASENHRATASP